MEECTLVGVVIPNREDGEGSRNRAIDIQIGLRDPRLLVGSLACARDDNAYRGVSFRSRHYARSSPRAEVSGG